MVIKESQKRKEIMRITVFDDNLIELIVNGNRRRVTQIKFEVGMDRVPILETSEPIVYLKENDNETDSDR